MIVRRVPLFVQRGGLFSVEKSGEKWQNKCEKGSKNREKCETNGKKSLYGILNGGSPRRLYTSCSSLFCPKGTISLPDNPPLYNPADPLAQQKRGKKWLPFHSLSNKQKRERQIYLKQFAARKKFLLENSALKADAAVKAKKETPSEKEENFSPTAPYVDENKSTGRSKVSVYNAVRIIRSFRPYDILRAEEDQGQNSENSVNNIENTAQNIENFAGKKFENISEKNGVKHVENASKTGEKKSEENVSSVEKNGENNKETKLSESCSGTKTATEGTNRDEEIGEKRGEKLENMYEFEKKEDVYLNLRIRFDPTRESVRGCLTLPHPLPTKSTLLVFCDDTIAHQMIACGADYAGLHQLSIRIANGWVGFDRCIASPDVLPSIIKLAKVLGPKRLMPSIRTGTVCRDLPNAIAQFKSGAQLDYRADDNGIIRLLVAHTSFPQQKIIQNIQLVIKNILDSKPASQQGEGGGKNSKENSISETITNYASIKERKAALQESKPALKEFRAKEQSKEDFLISASLETPTTWGVHIDTNNITSVSHYLP